MKIKKNLKLDDICVYLFLFVTLTFWISTVFNLAMLRMIQLIPILLLLINHKFVINKNGLMLLFLLICLQLLTMMFSSCFINMDIGLITSLLLSFLITSLVEWKDFREKFVKYMVFISIYSLATYTLYLIIPQFFYKLPTVNATALTANVFFTSVPIEMNSYYRNFGCCCEPGMFQVYLNIALLIELLSDHVSFKRVVVLVLTVITTFSTAGYLVLGVIIGAFLFNHNNKKIKRYIFLALIAGAIIFVYAFFKGKLGNRAYVFNKLLETGKDTGTTFERIRALNLAWGVFKEFLFIGCGFDYWASIARKNIILTFTPLNYFALFGIFYGIIMHFCIFNERKVYISRASKIVYMIVYVVLVMLMSSQDMTTNVIWNIMIFYSVTTIKNRGQYLESSV